MRDVETNAWTRYRALPRFWSHNQAADHDMGCEEKHTPFGVVNEDSGSLHLSFGRQVQPRRALLGNPGKALERRQADRYPNDVGVGEWLKSMTWKGVHPVVELSRTVYEKGISVAKDAMQAVESRLERNPLLTKWDILIRPASTV